MRGGLCRGWLPQPSHMVAYASRHKRMFPRSRALLNHRKEALKEIPEAKTKWPTIEQQRDWAAAMHAKESSITDCFAVAKCERYKVHKPTERERGQVEMVCYDSSEQRVLLWLDGTILCGKLNYPDEGFEDDLSSGLDDHFRDKQGGRCVVDGAFPICDPDSPEKHLLRPRSYEELVTARPEELARHFAIEAIHRFPEFGVDNLNNTYRILSYALPFDPNARKIRLANITCLYNLHIRSQHTRRSLTHEFESESSKRARVSF